MGSRELIVRPRRSEKSHKIICRLSVSYDHMGECLRSVFEVRRCVSLDELLVRFFFFGVRGCAVVVFPLGGVRWEGRPSAAYTRTQFEQH